MGHNWEEISKYTKRRKIIYTSTVIKYYCQGLTFQQRYPEDDNAMVICLRSEAIMTVWKLHPVTNKCRKSESWRAVQKGK